MDLEQIKSPVAADLRRYEEYLRAALHSDDSLVDTMLRYILDGRGKGVRPLMALLSASIWREDPDGALPGESYMAAMLVEMIHTASLVHDDIIDEALMRRGRASVNALWRSQKAVLIGDFILARSYSAGMESGAYPLVHYITRCMGDICEGELIQSDQSDRLAMTHAIYETIIYKKTATLIGASCGAGALSVGAAPDRVEAMKRMGDAVGMAFQIRDDILDYMPAARTGKPALGDLRERKITLPLLTVIEQATPGERGRILSLLSGVRSRPGNVDRLMTTVLDRGGIAMATAVMDRYLDEAFSLLAQCPPSACRDSMSHLFTFVAGRDK